MYAQTHIHVPGKFLNWLWHASASCIILSTSAWKELTASEEQVLDEEKNEQGMDNALEDLLSLSNIFKQVKKYIFKDILLHCN